MNLRRVLAALLICFTLFTSLPAFEISAKAETMPYKISVDLENQITTIYSTEDNSIVRQMLCSTGVDDLTPTGTFTMCPKKKPDERTEWYFFAGYRCYAHYASRIVRGVMFHSIPCNRKDDASISKTALEAFGTRASHGCIRLRTPDAEFIAKNCLVGTKVTIFEGAEPDPELRALLMDASYTNENGMSYKTYLGIPDDPSVLGRGSEGSKVTDLQYRLRALGFYEGNITDSYNSNTTSAVKQLQRAMGLAETGYVTTDLAATIFSSEAPTSTNVKLSDGMSGPSVRNLQSHLATMRLYEGDLDGIYDVDVIDSVTRFQQVYGYTPDGVATSDVQQAIAYESDNLEAYFNGTPYMLSSDADTIPMATVSARARVRIRSEASTSSTALDKLSDGETLIVLEKGNEWSQIRYGSTIGYMLNEYLNFSETELAMLTYTSSEFDSEYTIGSSLEDYINGAELPSVKFANRLTAFEAKSSPAALVQYATVNTRQDGVALNLRATPSTNGEVIAALENGTQLEVMLRTAVWTLVNSEAGSGYLMNEYLEFWTGEGEATSAEEEMNAADFESTLVAIVNEDSNVFDIDSEDANVLGGLREGTQVKILQSDDLWSLIEYNGRQGYMHNESLDFSDMETEI